MEGERRLLSKQVEYATLSATITEEFKAPAQALPSSLGTQFRNAAVDGYQSVVNFVIGVALFLVSDGPMLLLWVLILFFPARYAWRRLPRSAAVTQVIGGSSKLIKISRGDGETAVASGFEFANSISTNGCTSPEKQSGRPSACPSSPASCLSRS